MGAGEEPASMIFMEWKLKNNNFEFSKELEEKYSSVILSLLSQRNIIDPEEIERYFSFDYEKDLPDPSEIPEIKKAVERIAIALGKKEKVAIFGDYDADGVTASALLYETLTDLGFSDVVCYIPDRQTEGYGMNEKAVEYLSGQKVDLIITVDCGVGSVKEVELAKKLGMDVIITDHHNLPEALPKAVSIINPHIENSGFSFTELAGVGVAFKLATALVKKISPDKIEQLKWLLDLVAIGTIADCVPMLGENRVLVRYGLIVLSKTKRIGLQEIFKVGRIEISEDKIPEVEKVAFQIAPRINAAGRMDHANAAYKLLIEKKPAMAEKLAKELESHNQARQKMTKEIFEAVRALASEKFSDKKFIYAASHDWPVGILGLVAGKITEEFRKPTVILQEREDDLAGSLRSIPEVDIYAALKECQDALETFGGHDQAAGMTIKKENLEKFYEKMNEAVEKQLEGRQIVPTLEIDTEISTSDINWHFMQTLKEMEPFGIDNEQPKFMAKDIIVSEAKIVGNGQKHWKLALRGESGGPKVFDAIGFSLAERFPDLKKDDKIEVVFNLEEDSWNGNKKIQMKLIDLKIIGHQ